MNVEAGPGDFLYVPAQFNHFEGNPYDEFVEVILSRGPGEYSNQPVEDSGQGKEA